MSDEQSWLERLSHFFSREPSSQAELIKVLRHAEKRELIDRDALQMIEGVLAVSDKQVRDVMVPRSQMVMLKATSTVSEAVPTVIQAQHSRFPVMDDVPGHVQGILLAKDLLRCISIDSSRVIGELVRPAVLVPESKRLDILLKEFRGSHQHMAIVVDEYGGACGLITIEDVLEEIVGEIEDEYDSDDTDTLIKVTADGYLVSALTPIQDVNRYFHTHFNDTDFDTIGGLVLQKFSYVPKRDEKILLNDFEVTVMKAKRRGILMLQFKKIISDADE